MKKQEAHRKTQVEEEILQNMEKGFGHMGKI